jgi:hypothetical protein
MTNTDGASTPNLALAKSGEVLPPQQPDLLAIARTINTKHKAILDNLRNAVNAAMDCGDALAKAKALLDHGEFLAWLRDNCDVMPRTVQEWMFLARHRRQVEQWLRENPNGSVAGALKLIRQSTDPNPDRSISEDEVVTSVIKKVQSVLGKEHRRGLVVAARIVERLKDMRLVD